MTSRCISIEQIIAKGRELPTAACRERDRPRAAGTHTSGTLRARQAWLMTSGLRPGWSCCEGDARWVAHIEGGYKMSHNALLTRAWDIWDVTINKFPHVGV